MTGRRGSSWRSLLVIAAVALVTGPVGLRADTDTDLRVKLRIERRLLGQVALHFEHLGLEVNGGVATVDGSVASLGERRDAERIIGSVAGVQGVVNNLSIRPTHGSSAILLQEVERELSSRPRFDTGAIRVSATGTTITLTGEVQRGVDKVDAGNIAAGVAGVTQVLNELRISGAGDVSPETIGSHVRSALLNPLSFGVIRDLEVAVDGSVVTLGGTAARPSDRDAAERIALTVPGVTEVVNRIVVE